MSVKSIESVEGLWCHGRCVVFPYTFAKYFLIGNESWTKNNEVVNYDVTFLADLELHLVARVLFFHFSWVVVVNMPVVWH